MKRNLFFALTASVVTTLFTACNSDNDIECPEDYTGALAASEEKMQGDWVLTGMMADTEVDLTDDEEDNPIKDLFAQYEDCQKDASYTFGSDRSYTYKQSHVAEDCDNKATLSGTWKLTGEVLSLVGACIVQNISLNIKDDASEFSFTDTFNIQDVDGKVVQAKVTFTYTAQ